MSTKFRTGTLTLAISMALGTLATHAVAADDNKAKEQAVERIAVVGSRGAPRSVDDSPVPIDLIGAEELEKSGNTDMLELVKGTVHHLTFKPIRSLMQPAWCGRQIYVAFLQTVP